MKIGDVYYEKHTVTEISHRTGKVSETQIEIIDAVPMSVIDDIRQEIKRRADSREDDQWYERGTYYECLDIIESKLGGKE